MTTRFSFLGEVLLPKKDSKKPFFKEIEKNKRKMLSLNFGVKASNTNVAFVEMFGSERDPIITMNSDNEKIEVDWDNRFDEDIVSTIANYRTFTIDLGEDFGGRQTFITEYDAINYINENLPHYKGRVFVTGDMVKDFYKGKWYDKFKVQNIYAVNDDRPSRLSILADIYYNKDSVDKADYKTDKKIFVNGYIQQYFGKDEGNKFVPHQFVFCTEKYDLNNEMHQKLLNYRMQYVDVDSKKMKHLLWETVLVRGAEEVEFDESMLSKKQLEQIELGIKTIDDFKPSNGIVGDKINEYRLCDPKLKGDFAEGLIDADYTAKEFEDEIWVEPTEENLDEVINNAAKEERKVTDTESEVIDVDSLF